MARKEITDLDYAKFKEFIYEVYLRNLEEPDKDLINKQKEAVHKFFDSEQLDKIYEDTISFPYDLELFNRLIGVKLSPENLDKIANEFNISLRLLVSKIKEYTMYPIGNINGQNLIDPDIVLKLSKLYANRLNEKNDKSVDFLGI